MNDNDIEEILKSKSIPELIIKMGKFYPKGFNIERIDKRIKNKIKELENVYSKNNSDLEEIGRLNKKHIICI